MNANGCVCVCESVFWCFIIVYLMCTLSLRFVNALLFFFRATHVQNEDGSVVLLNPHNPRQRQAIAFKLLAPGKEGDTGGATKKVGLLYARI